MGGAAASKNINSRSHSVKLSNNNDNDNDNDNDNMYNYDGVVEAFKGNENNSVEYEMDDDNHVSQHNDDMDDIDVCQLKSEFNNDKSRFTTSATFNDPSTAENKSEDLIVDNIDESLDKIRDNVMKLMSNYDEQNKLRSSLLVENNQESIVHQENHSRNAEICLNNGNTVGDEDETTSVLSYGDDDGLYQGEDDATGNSSNNFNNLDMSNDINIDYSSTKYSTDIVSTEKSSIKSTIALSSTTSSISHSILGNSTLLISSNFDLEGHHEINEESDDEISRIRQDEDLGEDATHGSISDADDDITVYTTASTKTSVAVVSNDSTVFLTSPTDYAEVLLPSSSNDLPKCEQSEKVSQHLSTEIQNLMKDSYDVLLDLEFKILSPTSSSTSILPTKKGNQANLNYYADQNEIIDRKNASLLGLQRQKIWSYAHNAQLEREVATLQRHLAEMDKVVSDSTGDKPVKASNESKSTNSGFTPSSTVIKAGMNSVGSSNNMNKILKDSKNQVQPLTQPIQNCGKFVIIIKLK